jgi:hypothetical protein
VKELTVDKLQNTIAIEDAHGAPCVGIMALRSRSAEQRVKVQEGLVA